MAIIAAEMTVYRSTVVSDAASNGGRMDRTKLSADNTDANVFPELSAQDLVDGLTRWRKTFGCIDNAGDLSLINPRMFIEEPTLGGDHVVFHVGTQRDIQSDLTGSEDLYGAGSLDSTISVAATTLDVLVEDWSESPIFRDAGKIIISDGTNTEFRVLNAAPTPVGDVITLAWATGLDNGYSSLDTFVASVYEPADIAASATAAVVTSASGTFDDAELTVHNKGSIEQDITATFTSATAFDATGDELGAMGSGNISSPFSPANPDTGTDYFTIAAAAWGGTYATNDTVTFTMSPPAAPIWEKQFVPPATSSIAGNTRVNVLEGESSL